EVDLQPLPRVENSLALGVEAHVLHANARPHRRPLGLRRHASLAAIEAPRLDEGPHGDVKRAVRFLVQTFREHKQVEQSPFDRYGMPCRAGIEPADLAAIAVNGKLRLEPVDL